MQLQFKVFLAVVLLATSATRAWSIQTDGVAVNVEAMIGEATLVQESGDGKQNAIVVPTGQTTQQDPTTGATALTPATVPNRVNEVVHAFAATSADADDRPPTDEGCSHGKAPLRSVPQPEHDEAVAAFIAQAVEVMSRGELLMVIAVMINNSNHLCIDSGAVANAITVIAALRPEVAQDLVDLANLLDPENIDRYNEAVRPPTNQRPPVPPDRDPPPGGTITEPPPSPE